jgi:hypothetical protein
MSYSDTPPPPPPPGSGGPGGYGSGAYGGGYGGYAQPQNNKKAIWALITGILSIVCCGIFAGVPALILGNSAKKEIAASGGSQTGAGMAQAGFILGIISVVLTVIYVILVVAGTVSFPSGSTSP